MNQILAFSHARKSFGDKVVLDDVTLAFLPGAKIGVVGPNGTGKSSLLRMMAGVEQPSNGDARLMPGFTVGLLDQEPELDESKTVLGNVEDDVAETKALLARYNEIAELMATDYSDELLEEPGWHLRAAVGLRCSRGLTSSSSSPTMASTLTTSGETALRGQARRVWQFPACEVASSAVIQRRATHPRIRGPRPGSTAKWKWTPPAGAAPRTPVTGGAVGTSLPCPGRGRCRFGGAEDALVGVFAVAGWQRLALD
jgi:energy-coupling factor transporter ATP-binding protein EcfA2